MMNKAVLVGSPPLQEELLRPRRRQQPRQRPRPWEGASLFFLIGGNGYVTINNMCQKKSIIKKKASGHGVVSYPLFINIVIIRGNLSTIM